MVDNWYNGFQADAWQAMWNGYSQQQPIAERLLPGNIDFFALGGQFQWIRWEGHENLDKILAGCSTIAAIVGKKADAFVAGDVQCYNPNTDKKARGEGVEWEQLLRNPNPLQGQKMFLKQLYSFIQLQGWCYVLKTKPAGFDKPSRLWVLPSSYIHFGEERARKRIYSINRRELLEDVYFKDHVTGVLTPLDPDSLMLFTDTTPTIDPKTKLPRSRLWNLQYETTGHISSMEALATLTQKKGPIGILSNGSSKDNFGAQPFTPEQKEQLQREFQSYGLTRNQKQVIMTSASLSWLEMGYDVAQLQLMPQIKRAAEAACDIYNYPFELLANEKGTTFANKNEGKKSLYQDAIIPEMDSIFEQYDTQIGYDWQKLNTRIDYTQLAIFQEDKERAAKARNTMSMACEREYKNNIITKNQWLMALGLEPIPEGDVYYEQTNEAKSGQGSTRGQQENAQ